MSDIAAPSPAARVRLWAECLALFAGVPALMLVFFGAYSLFAVLWALAALSLALLAATPGFRFRDLLRGPVLGEWRLILGFAVACAIGCTLVAWALAPQAWLAMPRYRVGFWLTLLALYPLLSALPQEFIFRALFFERYGPLFPNRTVLIAANSAAFAVGHLFYVNPVAVAMSAAGGAVIAWAYARGRSFLLAVVLHALAGQIMFTAGLGRFFYHGMVGRAW